MKMYRKFSRNYLYQSISGALLFGLMVSARAVDGVPPYPAVVPLNTLKGATTGFGTIAPAQFDLSGTSVSGIGDINGDGRDDVLIGAREYFGNFDSMGRGDVVFGRHFPPNLFEDIVTLPVSTQLGFNIVGVPFSRTGNSASNAGDVNGDGFGDLIIGASYYNAQRGAAYVIFGRPSNNSFPATIDLNTDLTGIGFRIAAEANSQQTFLGRSVSGAGDINGDGIDDLVIADAGGHAYVIFGRPVVTGFPSVFSVDNLDGTANTGFRIDGVNASFNIYKTVSRAGNMNGDHNPANNRPYDDIIVGANGNSTPGNSYVLFGHNAPFGTNGVLSVATLDGTTNGFRIDGVNTGDSSGRSVSGGGDINGDGFSDVIIGAPYADPLNVTNTGSSYVVFGHTGSFGTAGVFALSSLNGSNGFRIDGVMPDDNLGSNVSILADFNDDGLDDILIGAPGIDTDPQNSNNVGGGYVVFGRRANAATFALATLTTLKGIRGFQMNGVGGAAGSAINSAGDVNDDGLNDLIIGAPDIRVSHVVFGNDDRIFAAGLEQGD